MLAFLSFFFLTGRQKHREETNHRVYQTDTHGTLGGLKATEPHLRLLQRALTEKPGFTGEPGAQADVDNTASSQAHINKQSCHQTHPETSTEQPDQDSVFSEEKPIKLRNLKIK